MNEELKKQILDKIKEYNKIVICRHFRPDGDAVGSTKGLSAILRATFPEKDIRLINDDYSDYMAFLGKEDEQVDDQFYSDALVIVMDTATEDRISNKKYALGREIIKFDHHINVSPYGSVCWVEEERSSCCEMVAEFYSFFKDELTITKEAALYIYTGMVTDSGRFRYSSTSPETLRLAAIMLEQGIDTDKLYANLYLDEFSELKFKSHIYKSMKITENGVAYVFVTLKDMKKFGITQEQASNSVFYLDGIKGSIIWLAFIENKDGSVRVRLRSRFITVSELANKYRGGGHACAAGATVYSKKEMKRLVAEADEMLGKYKAEHEDLI
jgi:phosphoesterase RecJ-like protein